MSNLSLDEACEKYEVIYSDVHDANQNLHMVFRDYYNKLHVGFINKIFQEYINYSSQAEEFINQKLSLLQINFNESLGVSSRGSDYSLSSHPKQPSLDEINTSIEYFISKYAIKTIFLVTEEEEKIKYYVQKYPDLIVFNKRNRISNYNQNYNVIDWANKSEKHFINTQFNYLYEVEVLSKCRFYIGGKNNGSAAVIEKNNLNFTEYKIL